MDSSSSQNQNLIFWFIFVSWLLFPCFGTYILFCMYATFDQELSGILRMSILLCELYYSISFHNIATIVTSSEVKN